MNYRIGFVAQMIVLSFVMTVVSFGLAQAAFADTPPPLPSTYQWNDANSGTHWFQASSLEEVENAFNAARAWENSVLAGDPAASYLPIAEMNLSGTFTLSEWYALSIADRTLWLINDTRTARGLPEYEGIDPYLNEVSADFAEFMFSNNVSGHSADGSDASSRAINHPEIDSNCPTVLQESIAYTGGTAERNAYFPVAIAVYNWIYIGTSGHRASILYHGEDYIDDTGRSGAEGLIGIGMIEGTGYGAFGGRFSDNIQILVYNHYDPSSTCANVPAVPIDQNTIIINEIDYVDDGAATFVEFYNTGTTSLSVRDYSLAVDGKIIQLAAEAIRPNDYLVLCSDNSLVDRCDYEYGMALSWSNGSEVALQIAGQAVDTVTLTDDSTARPQLGMSRYPDGTDWSARCATPGSQNTARDDSESNCDQPFATVSQDVIVTYDGAIAIVDYEITMIANVNAATGSNFVPSDTPYEGYNCDTAIATELFESELLQGTWMCTATISLAHDRCTPELVHEVLVNVEGLSSPVIDQSTVILNCEEPPATTQVSLAQSVQKSTIGLGQSDAVKVVYTVQTTNIGEREADVTLVTTADAKFDNYSCTGTAIQTVGPGETAEWICTADVSLAYGSCNPQVTHAATISGALLADKMTDTQTTMIPCQQYPPFTTMTIDQAVLTAEIDGDQLLLNYTVDVTNTGERPAAIIIQTSGDGMFLTYECTGETHPQVAPGDSTTLTCVATTSLENAQCVGDVTHGVTIQSADLQAAISDDITNQLDCKPIPTQVTTSHIVASAKQPLILFLTSLLISFSMGGSLLQRKK